MIIISPSHESYFNELHLELEIKYEKKMRDLRDELDLRRKTEIHEIEEVSVIFRYLVLILLYTIHHFSNSHFIN